MSWKRFGQLSAETQSLADVEGLTGPTGATISSTEKYTGGFSYRFYGSLQPVGISGMSHTAARAGMFFRHNGINGSGFASILGMMVDGAPVVWGLNLSTSEVTLRAGWEENTSTVRFPVTITTSQISTLNNWYSIGMTARFASTAGFVSLYVNGQLVATWEGNTNVFRSNENIPRTQISGCYAVGTPTNWMTGVSSWKAYTYIDDFYVDVWDGANEPIDAPPPSRRFLAVFPSGPGSSTQWTPSTGANWEAVNEAPPNDETDYVKALGANLLDLYDFTEVSIPADHSVRAVIPMSYARKSDAGVDSQLKLVTKVGNNMVKSDPRTLPIDYGYVWERWETQPDGVTLWDETSINAAEFGIESTGTF